LPVATLYFLLAGTLDKFRYLHYGIAFVLVFVGIKMIMAERWHPPIWISLLMLVVGLGGSIVFSVIIPETEEDLAARTEKAKKVERADVGHEKDKGSKKDDK
jgi:tellurite resistance protein TerC